MKFRAYTSSACKRIFVLVVAFATIILTAEYMYTKGICFKNDKGENLIIYSSHLDTIINEGQLRHLAQNGHLSDVVRPLKRILVWNSYFSLPLYGLVKGTSSFKDYGCPVHQCTLTNDSDTITEADAVVFHSFLLGGMPIPRRTSQKQIYVFMIFESPLLANQYDWLSGLSDTFNLTASYMDDGISDVHIPSGATIPGQVINDDVNKTRLVFWLVSNCKPISARDDYVTELSRYIQVDTYGKCGNSTCPKGDWTCFHNYTREYYFVLAFENSHCDGYVTEKVFKALKKPVVPVVLGGCNYTNILPPGSYINVQDFNGPRALANHLVYLSKTPEKYQEYFKWKNQYAITDRDYERAQGFCKLCKILHNDSYKYKTNFNPAKYWDPDIMCITGTKERRILNMNEV